MSPILVTGAAGFVGYHVSRRLLARGDRVVGVDEFNAYYDPTLKAARTARLCAQAGFELVRMDIADGPALQALVDSRGVTRVIHLAAQAGVRYSLDNPFAYERANLAGHLSVLEACRRARDFEHLVYASSSSVYGDHPLDGSAFREDDPVDAPVSLYAATKRSAELMSGTYAHLYGSPQTGLRLFTVYGPWGRPDMAYFSFTRKILAGERLEIYGQGAMQRDFTFIDDMVDGVLGVLDRPPPTGIHRILNVGANRPERLMSMISILEQAIGREADKSFLPMQPGDVVATRADISRLSALTGYAPKVGHGEGLPRFVHWYRAHYAV